MAEMSIKKRPKKLGLDDYQIAVTGQSFNSASRQRRRLVSFSARAALAVFGQPDVGR